jgi:hypothetical protein
MGVGTPFFAIDFPSTVEPLKTSPSLWKIGGGPDNEPRRQHPLRSRLELDEGARRILSSREAICWNSATQTSRWCYDESKIYKITCDRNSKSSKA